MALFKSADLFASPETLHLNSERILSLHLLVAAFGQFDTVFFCFSRALNRKLKKLFNENTSVCSVTHILVNQLYVFCKMQSFPNDNNQQIAAEHFDAVD